MLTHPSDGTLMRFLDAELAERRRTRVARHLARCSPCANRLHALSRASITIDALTRPDQAAPAEHALRARLRSRLSAAAGEVPTPGEQRGWAGLMPLALVATSLIAAAALVSPVHRAGGTGLFPEALSTSTESGMLPDPSLTPGSVRRTTAAELCGATRRSIRPVAPAVRVAVLRAYGVEHVSPADYELDHLITPELGGASDRENLWPERYGSRIWNARVKDDLESLLPRLVCEGRLELAIAQHDIAVDWIAAYKKYFHVSAPLTTQVSADDDDAPMVAASPRFVALAQLARR